MRYLSFCLLLLALIALTACNSIPNTISPLTSPILTTIELSSAGKIDSAASDKDAIVLFRNSAPDAPRFLALLHDVTPVVVDGCVLLSGKDKVAASLPIWMGDVHLKSDPTTNKITIVDSKDVEVAQIGVMMDLGGGGKNFKDTSVDFQNHLKAIVSAECFRRIQHIVTVWVPTAK